VVKLKFLTTPNRLDSHKLLQKKKKKKKKKGYLKKGFILLVGHKSKSNKLIII